MAVSTTFKLNSSPNTNLVIMFYSTEGWELPSNTEITADDITTTTTYSNIKYTWTFTNSQNSNTSTSNTSSGTITITGLSQGEKVILYASLDVTCTKTIKKKKADGTAVGSPETLTQKIGNTVNLDKTVYTKPTDFNGWNGIIAGADISSNLTASSYNNFVTWLEQHRSWSTQINTTYNDITEVRVGDIITVQSYNVLANTIGGITNVNSNTMIGASQFTTLVTTVKNEVCTAV